MTEVVERPMPTGEGLTFEKVWAMYQETDRKFQETDSLIKQIAEWQKEIERIVKKFSEDWKRDERTVDITDEQMDELSDVFIPLADKLKGENISKPFNKLGYYFDLIVKDGCEITDRKGKILTEVDILLENEETVIAVEVKAKPVLKDIDHHIKQLKIVKEKWKSIKKENKKVLGGIAGAIWDKDLKKAVQSAGLFVIEQSGDTFMIDMPEGWKPVEF
jgi:Holliday junction resolvase-like predicted endonuclease